MAQAETTLQERIDGLDRKLTAKQLEELKGLVALLGFKLTPLKASKPKLSIWAKAPHRSLLQGHPLRSSEGRHLVLSRAALPFKPPWRHRGLLRRQVSQLDSGPPTRRPFLLSL